jgi:hypothetical protein
MNARHWAMANAQFLAFIDPPIKTVAARTTREL